MTDDVRSKLLKVKALAEAGSAGEREAARAMLNRLISKHGLEKAGFIEEPKQQYDFSYENKFEKRLLIQIYAKVTKQSTIRYKAPNKRSKRILVDLTEDQHTEMKKLYSVYRKAFKKELERVASGLIDAFIHKHDLWSGVASDEETEPMTAEESQLLRDLYRNLEEVELPFLAMPERFGLRFAARHGRGPVCETPR
ncbi:MAG: hypothetical protein AMJ54_13230 [Deltaproteobacteria bacterium SG8_13]|nr:MAG: hypothetical protein AMJ54_13230 [Deltaproteobacteria bacterium SG8_13]